MPETILKLQTNAIRQFVRYCIVGIINTAIDVLLYVILTRYLGFTGNWIYAAKALAYCLATFNSFAMNRAWTFERRGRYGLSELARFYIFVGSGVFLNTGVHFVDVRFFGMNDILSSLVAAVFTAAWGFTFAKLVVFQ